MGRLAPKSTDENASSPLEVEVANDGCRCAADVRAVQTRLDRALGGNVNVGNAVAEEWSESCVVLDCVCKRTLCQ